MVKRLLLLVVWLPILCNTAKGEVTIIASATEGCDSLTVSFSFVTSGVTTINSARWTFGNGQTTDQNTPSPVFYAKAGTYTVNLTLQTAEGVQTDETQILVYRTPDVSYWYDQPAGFNSLTRTIYNPVQGAGGLPNEEPATDFSRNWALQINTTTEVYTDRSFTVTFPEQGTYPLSLEMWVTGYPSCRADTSGSVYVYDKALMSYFTPNNDGPNDVYEIGLDGITELSFEVFSRYGIRVFAQTAPTIQWDGRSMSGAELSEGVYYYIISCPLSIPEYNRTGFIHLFR